MNPWLKCGLFFVDFAVIVRENWNWTVIIKLNLYYNWSRSWSVLTELVILYPSRRLDLSIWNTKRLLQSKTIRIKCINFREWSKPLQQCRSCGSHSSSSCGQGPEPMLGMSRVHNSTRKKFCLADTQHKRLGAAKITDGCTGIGYANITNPSYRPHVSASGWFSYQVIVIIQLVFISGRRRLYTRNFNSRY